jgi:hypothetical protein
MCIQLVLVLILMLNDCLCRLHDFDNNTKLDGLEILQAIHHTVHYNEEQSDGGTFHDHQQQIETQTEKSKNSDQDDFDYFVGK